REWLRELAARMGASAYHMIGAVFSDQLADFTAPAYELFEPDPAQVPALMDRYVRDPVTGLLVLESLAANPLPVPDVDGAAEQAWLALGGSLELLEIQLIVEGDRVRGLVLPSPSDTSKGRPREQRQGLPPLPDLPAGPVPEGLFVVLAHASIDGLVLGPLPW